MDASKFVSGETIVSIVSVSRQRPASMGSVAGTISNNGSCKFSTTSLASTVNVPELNSIEMSNNQDINFFVLNFDFFIFLSDLSLLECCFVY